MTQDIRFGFSPCPNDTFAFYALVHGLVQAPGFSLRPVLADVEQLNRWALAGELALSKLSFHALGAVLERYALLRAGSALGRGCGPLLVARPGAEPTDLASALVAVPGQLTTAHLLLSLYLGRAPRVQPMVFSEVMSAVAGGRADAGLIIHEGRFIFAEHGLVEMVDLGAWWEEVTGLPIPLGCIAVRRDLGAKAASVLERALAQSVSHALEHPGDSAEYVAAHAQEMDPAVQKQHIGLYVNRFSVDLGEEGLAAVREVLARGRAAGLLPGSAAPLCLT